MKFGTDRGDARQDLYRGQRCIPEQQIRFRTFDSIALFDRDGQAPHDAELKNIIGVTVKIRTGAQSFGGAPIYVMYRNRNMAGRVDLAPAQDT